MNPSYRQTFDRHKVLFSLPIAITTLLAIWFVAGSPKEYKAGATLFIDNKSGESSIDEQNSTLLTPAARAQQFLNELLATKQFQGHVASRGPLAAYLAHNTSQGWSPTDLLRQARGSGSVADRTSKALDAKHVVTVLPGGQILGIELQGPTPKVAVGTLKALIKSFQLRRREIDVSRQQSAMTAFSTKMTTAKSEIARLGTKIANGGQSPPELQGLIAARTAAQRQLRSATRGYILAGLALNAAKKEKTTYHVVDKPSLPAPAVSGMKKSVMMVFAGAFVGFLISLLAVVLLTGTESRAAQDELRDVVAQAHNDPVPLDLDAVKTSNGNGSGVHEDAPARAERADRAG